MSIMYLLPIALYLFESGGGGYSDILGALTGAISVSTISSVLVAAITASIGIVFFWWAARKVTQVLFSAFRSGKLHA